MFFEKCSFLKKILDLWQNFLIFPLFFKLHKQINPILQKDILYLFSCTILGSFALSKTGYKRIYFDASEWSQYISKTTLFQSKSVIECGSACVAFGGCVLFVRDKESENCYLGHLDNVDTNYLTVESQEEEPQAVYLDLNTIGKLIFLNLRFSKKYLGK